MLLENSEDISKMSQQFLIQDGILRSLVQVEAELVGLLMQASLHPDLYASTTDLLRKLLHLLWAQQYQERS